MEVILSRRNYDIMRESIATYALQMHRKYQLSEELTSEQLEMMYHRLYEKFDPEEVEKECGGRVAYYLFNIQNRDIFKEKGKILDGEFYNYKRIATNFNCCYYKILARLGEIYAAINMGDEETFFMFLHTNDRFKRIMRSKFKTEFDELFQEISTLLRNGKKQIVSNLDKDVIKEINRR